MEALLEPECNNLYIILHIDRIKLTKFGPKNYGSRLGMGI